MFRFFFGFKKPMFFGGKKSATNQRNSIPQPTQSRARADFSGWRQPASGRVSMTAANPGSHIGVILPTTQLYLGSKKKTPFFSGISIETIHIFSWKVICKVSVFPRVFLTVVHLVVVDRFPTVQGPDLSTLSSSPAQPQALQRPWAELWHRLRSLKLT